MEMTWYKQHFRKTNLAPGIWWIDGESLKASKSVWVVRNGPGKQ